jgi:hypothetical protein
MALTPIKELYKKFDDERAKRAISQAILGEELGDICDILNVVDSSVSNEEKIQSIEATISTTTSTFVYDNAPLILKELETKGD